MRVALALVLLCPLMAPSPDDEGAAILKGDDVAQFELVGIGPDSIAIDGDEVRLAGQPTGYFATRGEYRDFELTFEFKYDRPEGLTNDAIFRGNSGALIHIARPHKVWPDCVEVQLAQGDPGSLIPLGNDLGPFEADPAAQKKAVKPVGEWNRVRVVSRDGAIRSSLNEVQVAKGEAKAARKGPIGWQSQGKPVRFRKLRIKAFD